MDVLVLVGDAAVPERLAVRGPYCGPPELRNHVEVVLVDYAAGSVRVDVDDGGQPGLAPWRLALVTICQFLGHLSDRQAADAVWARIDWKYALGLELTDAGFHFSVTLLRGSAGECDLR